MLALAKTQLAICLNKSEPWRGALWMCQSTMWRYAADQFWNVLPIFQTEVGKSYLIGTFKFRNSAQCWSSYVYSLNLYIISSINVSPLYTDCECMALILFTEGSAIPKVLPPPSATFLKGTMILASFNGNFHGNHPRNYFGIFSRDLRWKPATVQDRAVQ